MSWPYIYGLTHGAFIMGALCGAFLATLRIGGDQ